MSRKNKKVSARSTQEKLKAHDSFSNILGRIGFGTPSLLEATEYPINRLTRDYALMNSLYRNHWIVKRIVDTVPEDMCKNWLTLKTQVSPDLIKRFDLTIKRTATRKKLIDAIKWSRLYGGAAAVIIIDGHEDILDQPLDYDTIMPGSYCGLLVRDRWSGISPGPTIITDMRDVEFGLPDYYQVTNGDGSVVQVHHSRILRFIGRDLPEWEKQAEVLWGASEVEHVFDELKKRDNTSWNIANLVFRANLLTKQTENLDELTALGDSDVQSEVYQSLQAQNWLMNNFGIYMLGKGEQLDAKSYTFSGIAQVMEVFMYDIAGAAEMPFTKLFGRSPAGLNATGESDMQMYYDSIEQKQETYLSPALDKLLPVIVLSEWGYIPDDLDYGYNQIGTLSNSDKADLADKGSESIGKAYDRGLISARTALKELRQQSDITGYFTNITDEDIERASDQLEQFNESPPGMPFGNFEQRQSGDSLPAIDEEWKESDHPRNEGGQFTSGSGSGKIETEGKVLTGVELEKAIRNHIRTNQNLSIFLGRQNKHIPGTNEYKQYQEQLKKNNQFGPSYLTVDKDEAEQLVSRYAGTGDLMMSRKTDQWTKKEKIDKNKEAIGVVVNNLNGNNVKTSRFIIHYSDKGTHIVPNYPEKKGGE